MAHALEAHRRELLELFTCFCGTCSTLTLAGWLAFADAFDICPGYLSVDRLEEVHEAAAGHTGKGQSQRSASRPHGNGLTFSGYQEALCLLAAAMEEKRWKVEYGAEKAARYRYKLKDAEKGRVKPGSDEQIEGLLIALDVHDITRMRKRAGIPQGPMPSSGHADSLFNIDAPCIEQNSSLTDSSHLAGGVVDMASSVRRTASGVPPAVGAGRNSRRNTGKRAQTPTTPSSYGRTAGIHGNSGGSTPLSSPRPPASTPNSGQSHGSRPNSSPATSSDSSRRPGRKMRIAADQSFAQLASGRTPEPPTTPRTEHRPTPPSSPRAVPGQLAPASARSSSPRAPPGPHGGVAARNKENSPRGTSTGGSANVSRTTHADLCESNQTGSCQYFALSSRGREPQPLSDIDFVHALLTGSAHGQRKNRSSSTARSSQREGTAASAAGQAGPAQVVAKSRPVSMGRQGRSVQAAW